jgi:hypothetical protein
MSETTLNQESNWQRYANGFNSIRPAIQLILTVAVTIVVFVMARQRETFSQQTLVEKNAAETVALAAQVRDRNLEVDGKMHEFDNKLDSLRRDMMTREQFEEFRRSDTDRKDRLEKMMNQLLEQKSR